MKKAKNKYSLLKSKKNMLLAALLIVITVGLLFGFKHYNDSKCPQNKDVVTSPKPLTEKTSTSATSVPNPVNSSRKTHNASTQESQTQNMNTNTNTNTPIIKPSGEFVSNHIPGQNNTPQEEYSNCLTNPGATCVISFTNGSITKSLSSEVADSTGTATWQTWTPASLGLTIGSWTISAKVTLGQQSASTQDSRLLEIQ
jgi:hypothetical protein